MNHLQELARVISTRQRQPKNLKSALYLQIQLAKERRSLKTKWILSGKIAAMGVSEQRAERG